MLQSKKGILFQDMDGLPCPVNFLMPLCLLINLGMWYTIACMYGVTQLQAYV